MIMESKEIPCAVVDVAASAEDKAKMREIANDPACLPPQIAFGESYCGVSILDYYCTRYGASHPMPQTPTKTASNFILSLNSISS